MIVSLRGTSGSGKSHLVREVVGRLPRHRDYFEMGRKRPIYTIHGRNLYGGCVLTPGHYEIANGGVDTLRTLEDAYRIARYGAGCGHHVLMEGKNMSDGVRHLELLLDKGLDVVAVHVATPIEQCVASVRRRGHRIAERSIRKTDAKVRRDMEKFRCRTFSGDRDQCLAEVLRLLGIDDLSSSA